MTVITTIADLRDIARSKIPRSIFEYADCGAYTETTMRANRADLDAIGLRQRVLIDVAERSLATTFVGQPATMPLGVGPTGLTGLFYVDGEIHGCRAAQTFGIPFCLSTVSICSIEDVRQNVERPFWFQLYVMKDRGFATSLIERAKAAECSALVLTLDQQIQGQRHRDLKNGLTVPPRLTFANALNILSKPGWALSMLRSKRKTFGNLAGYLPKEGVTVLAQWIANQLDASLSWNDVEWIKSLWPGKLILKGILDAEDAKIAANCGVDAIVVSNHGGRQLDGARSSISVLPEIIDAAGGKIEILFDGGIRSGHDVLKAKALGAQGCLIGRAFLYSLAAGGEAGVRCGLEIMRKELDIAMALTGTRDIRDAGPHILATL